MRKYIVLLGICLVGVGLYVIFFTALICYPGPADVCYQFDGFGIPVIIGAALLILHGVYSKPKQKIGQAKRLNK
jgi:NO-binding membrane sensor protein with MHYT domain